MGSWVERTHSKAAARGPSGPTFLCVSREEQLESDTPPRVPVLGNKASKPLAVKICGSYSSGRNF